MKFAFLIHYLSEETCSLVQLDRGGALRSHWGLNVLEFCSSLHQTMQAFRRGEGAGGESAARLADEMAGLVSQTGARAEGRLYEVPMTGRAILEDPHRALGLMEKAIDAAADWGARVVGLGSMTGIVGGNGAYLAERGPLAVTTGNSLTVYAALQNLYDACDEAGIDLARETVAVLGVPGSIATAAATLLAPQCRDLLLVARRPSQRASRLAGQLGGKLLLDIPSALAQARVVLSATSTGNCIDQRDLLGGAVVVDVGVPTDVQGTEAIREDVLIFSGGLAKVPPTMPRTSMFLDFYQGTVPSCLGETMVLALEGRPECFSIGRDLDPDKIQEIGTLAVGHGFDFSHLVSFGQGVEPGVLAGYRKAVRRRPAPAKDEGGRMKDEGGQKGGNCGVPACLDSSFIPHPSSFSVRALADRAARRFARHINPVLLGVAGKGGLVKTFVRGQGMKLWDADGRSYLDFVGGFGAMNLGHNHPAVARAVAAALEQQAPGFAQAGVNPLAAAQAEQLVEVTPPGLEMVFFCNSGTEAVEAALKLARAATGRADLLYCERSFHGKSLGSLSVTGNPTLQRPFGPLLSGCQAVPFGDPRALESALATRRFAAFVVEPIQGEGGMNVPPEGYLRQAQRLCRAAGTLLVVDEVQTGLGRTGALFAVDHEGVEPDLMTLAKSLGGGLVPIGATLARRDLWMKAYGTVHGFALHSSTFGGGSLACAAGLAALRVLQDEGLVENAQARGRQLAAGLAALSRQCPLVKEVRGQGLLLGLEFNPLPRTVRRHFRDASGPAAFQVADLDGVIDSIPGLYVMQTLLQEHGIYTQVARSNPRVLRIQPPLTVTEEQAARFLDAITQTCSELAFLMDVGDRVLTRCVGSHQGEPAGNGHTLSPLHAG
jgi:acetylornithine/succinyldiaminopimelate/putrescine aminotransferase/predicted amino acid dehydrogenase